MGMSGTSPTASATVVCVCVAALPKPLSFASRVCVWSVNLYLFIIRTNKSDGFYAILVFPYE